MSRLCSAPLRLRLSVPSSSWWTLSRRPSVWWEWLWRRYTPSADPHVPSCLGLVPYYHVSVVCMRADAGSFTWQWFSPCGVFYRASCLNAFRFSAHAESTVHHCLPECISPWVCSRDTWDWLGLRWARRIQMEACTLSCVFASRLGLPSMHCTLAWGRTERENRKTSLRVYVFKKPLSADVDIGLMWQRWAATLLLKCLNWICIDVPSDPRQINTHPHNAGCTSAIQNKVFIYCLTLLWK